MTDAPTPAPAPAPAPPPTAPMASVIVRPMPKVVFFYLTWLVSLVFGIITSTTAPTTPTHLGTVWLCIFAFNLLVISFDFTEVVSIATIAVLLVIVFAGLYFQFLPFIGDFFRYLNIQMNANFYYAVFGLFSLVYGAVFLRSRFEYWEFRNNEVLHREGIFAAVKRYSTEDLRWFKEIPDVLERLLLRSGRMVLTTPREPSPIVIEHVIGIESVDDRIAELLGTKRVTIT